MSFTTCRIHFRNDNGKTVYASSELYKKLKLSSVRSVKLVLGQKNIQAPIRRINKTGSHLYLPVAVRSLMRIPRNGMSYVMSKTGELKIGPLIGIMTSSSTSSLSQPFGARSLLIKTFLRAGTNKAFYFAFRPRDINWESETVVAYFLDSAGGWKRKIVPLPDVVYNRLTSRRAERTEPVLSIKERFLRRGIPVFNWSYFDKWDVYKLLENDSDASPHVPESYINPSPEQIRTMLEKHRFIYLKPTAGSLGIGIFRLTYHKQRGYFARFRRNGKNVLLRFNRFDGLARMLRLSQGRMRNYVVQQGIRLIELDHCPIDFRFHMNKDGNNEWVVGGVGAKKAGRGSVTTHVRTGGQVMEPMYVMSRIYGEERGRSMLNEAKKVAVKLSKAIERNYKYRVGELGFDLGIDTSGRIWMFEANSKPGRSIFKHPALKAQGKQTLNLVFEHCLYLARFRKSREENA